MVDAEKPKRAGVPKGWDPAEMDLEKALMLLALPRPVGPHPEDGEMISAGIGRYGWCALIVRIFAKTGAPRSASSSRSRAVSRRKGSSARPS